MKDRLLDLLQKQVGFHRQLLDALRMEHSALAEADIKALQEAVSAKQVALEAIRLAEVERLREPGEFAGLTLGQIAIAIQGKDPKGAEQLRGAMNALTILIERAQEHNEENRALVERALGHVYEMKKNALRDSSPKSETYSQQGQRISSHGSSRLLSREA